MTTITHRFIEINGIRMHIAEAGEGPLVLLLHGFPESWYAWRHQLSYAYHVIYFIAGDLNANLYPRSGLIYGVTTTFVIKV
jgi:hypothetical protein